MDGDAPAPQPRPATPHDPVPVEPVVRPPEGEEVTPDGEG